MNMCSGVSKSIKVVSALEGLERSGPYLGPVQGLAEGCVPVLLTFDLKCRALVVE